MLYLMACLTVLLADLHGDPLPDGARARMGTIRFRPGAPITFLAFAPDGRSVLSSSGNGTLQLWDRATGKERRRFGATLFGSHSAAFTPGGRGLALVGLDVTLQIQDLATGKARRKLSVPPPGLALAAFAPDGNTVAVVGSDQVVRLGSFGGKEWRALTRPRQPAPGNPRGFGASLLTFSADGRLLAAGGHNGQNIIVHIWEVAGAREVCQLTGPPGGPSAIAFAPDSRTLAVAAGNQTVYLFEVPGGKEIRQLPGVQATDASLVFSPDGKLLLVGHGDRAQLVEVATGQVAHELPAPTGGCYAAAFAPDGRTLVTGGADAVLRFWDVATAKEVRPTDGHQAPISAVRLSPDGTILATSAGDGTVRLWEVATGKELRWMRRPEPTATGASDVRFNAAGTTLTAVWSDATLGAWEVATGRRLRWRSAGSGAWFMATLSPDERQLASVAPDGIARLRDVAPGREVRRFRPEGAPSGQVPAGLMAMAAGGGASLLAFSPDGRTLATGQGGGGGMSPFDGLVVSGGRMWGGGGTTVVRLWEVATGKLRGQIVLNAGVGAGYTSLGDSVLVMDVSGYIAGGFGGVRSLHFSPNGRTLLIGGDGGLHLWDLIENHEIRRFEGGLGFPSAVAFSADGKLLAVGNQGSFTLWEVATGKELATTVGHEGAVAALSFSADGKTLATGAMDTTALVWDVNALVAAGRRRVTQLSDQDLETLWKELGDGDAARAFQAEGRLVRAPARAVPLLRARLRPVPPVAGDRVARLVADLDNEKFAVRQRATDELEKLGDVALPALEKVLAGKPSLELRKRVEDLIQKLEGPVTNPDQLRVLRGIEVLEHIGTPEARQVLNGLSRG